jgi:hypothetical protein
MHDWLEKVAPTDCHAILMAFTNSGLFTLQAYNQALANIKLESYEVGDRPFPVKQDEKKLAGKALSVALHVRLMPVVICSVAELDEECDLVQLLVTIHSINEVLLADTVAPEDALKLQDLVVQYFSLRKACSDRLPSVFGKHVPKHHFIEHYAAQILKYGPCITAWVARYESRHRDFVNWCESSKNFVNVLKTLCDKNQKKMASRYCNMFTLFPVLRIREILVRIRIPVSVPSTNPGGPKTCGSSGSGSCSGSRSPTLLFSIQLAEFPTLAK